MDEIVKEWVKMSEYDLETGQAMLGAGRYLYVTFMCQQSVEKLLKAIYSQEKKIVPPRTHNLLYLVDVLRLDLTEPKKTFLGELNRFYLENRYPHEKKQLAQEIDNHQAANFLDKTKEFCQCLKQRLL